MELKCRICNSAQLEKLMTTKLEAFATGDRRRFDKGSRRLEKVICQDCGTVQFLQNDDYKSALDEVYGGYGVLHDKAWSAEESECRPRLRVMYEKVSQTISLPEIGNMLDIGCGGGESLLHFHRIYPEWNLYGMDIGEQFGDKVLEREQVKNFFSSLIDLESSGIKFDFISINDVLSLADNADEILRMVHTLLKDDGVFFVKESDYEVNPYLLYEVGCCFFTTKQHIENVISNFGFDILDVNFDMGKKAIGVFSRKSIVPKSLYQNSYEINKHVYEKKIEYLNQVIDTAIRYTEDRRNTNIGIFGVSVAGIWLSEIITRNGYVREDQQVFYVDEDEDYLRRKTGVNGYPIYRLDEIEEPAIFFLPFPQYVAENIIRRCEKKYKNLEFVNFKFV